jgi:hypothetical protein
VAGPDTGERSACRLRDRCSHPVRGLVYHGGKQRSFEGLLAEALLGSCFATLLPFAPSIFVPSITLLGTVSPLVIQVLEVGETAG